MGGRGRSEPLTSSGILDLALDVPGEPRRTDVLILDTLILGGFKFIFSKIAEAVDAELNDEASLREELLAAQMRLELGEMTDAEFADVEREVLRRIREIRERNRADAPSPRDAKITGVEATIWSDEDESEGDERGTSSERR